MNLTLKVFILCACFGLVWMTESKPEETTKSHILNQLVLSVNNGTDTSNSTETVVNNIKNNIPKRLSKRQIGFGGIDYYTEYLEYAAYDYYDWVCVGVNCQLCDVLTGDCCRPEAQPGDDDFAPNCFLPDSCANNPCLSGGSCVPTLTVGGQADFSCICRRGLTGKYCQLIDQYDPPLVAAPIGIPPPPMGIPPPPQMMPPQQPGYGGGYGGGYAGGFGGQQHPQFGNQIRTLSKKFKKTNKMENLSDEDEDFLLTK